MLAAGLIAATLSSCCTKESRTVRLMSYNVGAFSKEIDDSTPLVASLIKSLGAETVGLNEVDSCNARHGADQLAVLQEQLGQGWERQYARAMPYRGGAYGNGAVSKAGVVSSGLIALPRGDGSEPRSAAYIETPDYVFAQIHLDHVSENARLEQLKVVTERLKSLFGSAGKPVFLSGDFNSLPESIVIKNACEDWDILTPQELSYPSDTPKICIDYIMLLKGCPAVEVVSAGVCTAEQFAKALGPDIAPHIVSDHLPLYLEVRL